ncbi:MAG: TonB-dependent receptor [Bacteroidetes bacterium]|nr:TonB-dependent receptor [Bacteroidota bacterium]
MSAINGIATKKRIQFAGMVLAGLFLMAGSPGYSMAQQSIVRGTVVAAHDGEPLQGVNLALYRDGALVIGTASGSDGIYALAQIASGRYDFRATFVGFRTWTDSLDIGEGDRRIINIVLEEGETELDEVVVESDSDVGMARVLAGQTTVRPADVERIPSPDVSGDLINFLTTMPGIVSIGDRGGQLFIRGGEPWQNLVLLDGMWVYQPFHILGFFSSFPSEILQQVDIFAGGYTSQYGGRISSVIDIKSRNGDKKGYAGSATVAPFVSGFSLEGPIAVDLVSFLVSYRQSVIEEGASRLVDDELPFEFDDFFAKTHAFINANTQLSLSLLRTNDRGSVFEGNDLEDAEFVEWENRAASARYLVFPRAFPIMAEFIVSGSRLKSAQTGLTEEVRFSKLSSANTTVNVTHYHRNSEVRWGLFARTLELVSSLDGLYQGFFYRKEYATEVGAYLEPEFMLPWGWRVRAGLRIHSFPSQDTGFLEPRLRAIKVRERDEFTLAAGMFHQEIVGLTDRRDAAGIFTAWTTSTFDQGVPEAIHAIVGYRRAVTQRLEVSVEGYGKKLNNLFIPEWTAYPRFTTRIQPAEGRVLGADFRVEYKNKPFSGFVTYGLSNVRYTAKQESLELWYGDKDLDFRPAHDRRHQVNVVASLDLKPFDLDVRWQFGSGLPYSRALGFDGFMIVDGDLDVFRESGNRRVIYEEPYNGILPTYHRLDITAQRDFSLPGSAILTTHAGVINIYDRQNLFYLDVFTLRRVDQLPFIPTVGLKLAFE